ncbi:MAG: hypothetical protein ACPGO3_10895 [Magnetospiraceae bacterium]
MPSSQLDQDVAMAEAPAELACYKHLECRIADIEALATVLGEAVEELRQPAGAQDQINALRRLADDMSRRSALLREAFEITVDQYRH